MRTTRVIACVVCVVTFASTGRGAAATASRARGAGVPSLTAVRPTASERDDAAIPYVGHSIPKIYDLNLLDVDFVASTGTASKAYQYRVVLSADGTKPLLTSPWQYPTTADRQEGRATMSVFIHRQPPAAFNLPAAAYSWWMQASTDGSTVVASSSPATVKLGYPTGRTFTCEHVDFTLDADTNPLLQFSASTGQTAELRIVGRSTTDGVVNVGEGDPHSAPEGTYSFNPSGRPVRTHHFDPIFGNPFVNRDMWMFATVGDVDGYADVGSSNCDGWYEVAPPPASGGRIATNGLPYLFNIKTAGDPFDFTFGGKAGQVVTIDVEADRHSPACDSGPGPSFMWFEIDKPDGSYLTGRNYCGYLGHVRLPVDGTYTLAVDPAVGAIGTGTVAVWTNVDQTGTIARNGSPKAFNIRTPGQQVRFTFSAVAGQVVTVNVDADRHSHACDTANDAPAYSFMWFEIDKPDGTYLTGRNYCGYLGHVTLPVAGTYTLAVDPAIGPIGTGTITVWTNVDQKGPVATDGTPVAFNIRTPGQEVRRTFSAVAGQVVTVNVDADRHSHACDTANNAPAYTFMWFEIDKPDGTYLTGRNYCGYLGHATLPVAGKYTLAVYPALGPIGTGTIKVWTNVDQTGAIATDGSRQPFNVRTPGQEARFTFSGSAGQIVKVDTEADQGSDVCSGAYVEIDEPDGTILSGGSGCPTLDGVVLPVAGAYVLRFSSASSTGTGSFAITTE